MQVMEAVQNAVQLGIEQLSGTQVSSNAHPGDQYRFRARTKEELMESQQLAADSAAVDPRLRFKQLKDPAKQFSDVEHDEVNTQIRTRNGLILPSGYTQQQDDEPDGNRADERPSTDPMPWLL